MVDFAGFSREFLGQIFVEKQTRKQKRNIPDKNIGRMPNSGQERKKKVHSTQFWRQLYLFRATRKTNKALPKRLASKPPFSAAVSSRKQQRIKLLSLHRSLVLLCSLQGKIVLISKHSFYGFILCTIKRVPALLQTAVSFYSPYSVNETSSLLLCLWDETSR